MREKTILFPGRTYSKIFVAISLSVIFGLSTPGTVRGEDSQNPNVFNKLVQLQELQMRIASLLSSGRHFGVARLYGRSYTPEEMKLAHQLVAKEWGRPKPQMEKAIRDQLATELTEAQAEKLLLFFADEDLQEALKVFRAAPELAVLELRDIVDETNAHVEQRLREEFGR